MVIGQSGSSQVVQNCYATGNVKNTGTGGYIGGVVGVDGTTQNCVALAPNIQGSSYIGRVVGRINSGTLIDNFGRSDMKKNDVAPPTTTWTSNSSGVDGTSIDSTNWSLATWWTGTAGFNASDAAWDFTGISATRGPTLTGMPEGTQNPVIQ